MSPVAVKHPAAYSPGVLDAFDDLLCERFPDGARLLDPFAGTGRIHLLSSDPRFNLRYNTVGIELEPEWAAMHPATIVGDATALPFPDHSFEMAATSPSYGNRMADHHEARDGSYRRTYRHVLGRPLNPNNSGGMQWGGPPTASCTRRRGASCSGFSSPAACSPSTSRTTSVGAAGLRCAGGISTVSPGSASP